jgi:tetratricopeptide (TPR) repeat protein
MKSSHLLCLGLFYALFAFVSTLSAQTTAADFAASAKAKYSNGDFDGAIADYDKAIELNPGFASAYGNRGDAKKAKGEFDSAISDYNKAIELMPGFAWAYFIRGNAKQSKGDFAGAITDFNKAIELIPNDAMAFSNRGLAKYSNGDFDGAVSDCNKAIELNPRLANAYGNRGIAEKAKGDLDGAITDFDKVIELNPNLSNAYFTRGNAKQIKGDFDGAAADYAKFIKVAPNTADYARFNLALTLRRQHRDDAPAALAKVIATWKDGWIKSIGLYLTGSLAESDFLSQTARGEAKTVREHYCEAYYYVGMTHLLANKTAIAQNFFEKCLATNVTAFEEFQLARAELARLSAKQ